MTTDQTLTALAADAKLRATELRVAESLRANTAHQLEQQSTAVEEAEIRYQQALDALTEYISQPDVE